MRGDRRRFSTAPLSFSAVVAQSVCRVYCVSNYCVALSHIHDIGRNGTRDGTGDGTGGGQGTDGDGTGVGAGDRGRIGDRGQGTGDTICSKLFLSIHSPKTLDFHKRGTPVNR